MTPVKNPNNNTGTVPKAAPSASSSSSSVLETSPSGSSCISSETNMHSIAMRSNGLVVVNGGDVGSGVNGANNLIDGSVTGSVGGVGNIGIAPSATQSPIVPQSGGIGAVGGATSNAYVLRKNTEIVAPIRRELKDLNDYFLSVTESSRTSLPNSKRQNHHYHHRHQPPVTPLAGPSNLDGTACFEFDNYPDNQRSCYPVRPIPRRTAQLTRDIDNVHQSNNISLHSSCGIPINNQLATIGVVNPTTLGITNEEIHQHQRQTSNPFLRCRQPAATSAATNDFIDIDDILLQRYKYIQYCLKLANKSQNKNKDTMVNENSEHDMIVNSTSLEDVARSETSERAQSVTSIHSSIEPSTPTYEDLQNRLETSTRNIQNMKEQQQQLKHLQDQAKQHLAEMESLRIQTAPLRRGATENGAPDYETIDQVHTDMSSLVGRMKNLTTFIQGQNELSNLLGEDGPEIMAEQQTLQEKLEGLKSHRDEMKNLISELHEVNRIAERRAHEQQQQPKSEQPTGSGTSTQPESSGRVVPIEYSRIVPIELVGNKKKQQKQSQENHVNGGSSIPNGNAQSSEDESNEDPATAALIHQKMSDIQAMKNQLSRLKSMMETVKLIEERSEGQNPKDIGYSDEGTRRSIDIPVQRETTPKNTNNQQRVVGAAIPFDKDRTPVQDDFTDEPEDPAIVAKIQMLNEVTRDLRSQAQSLADERDRIRALKEEIMRRKAANAAASSSRQAASVDEDKNSKRERVSPSKLLNKDRDILEAQYEAKKKEFQNMCQRIENEEQTATADISAHEEEADEEDDINTTDLLNRDQGTPKPDLGYYFPQSQGLSCNSSVHGGTVKTLGKESADSGAVDVNRLPSCEAGSIKSGSSRSFSMPPPMRAMGNREASWRKSSQEHYDHFGPPNVSTGACTVGPMPPPLPASWNPCYFYNSPFSPHFVSQNTSGVGISTDCICQTNPNVIGNPAASMAMQSDPVMMQQFVQTQQMLINSVCQCNQMLWHQQREIDMLNSTTHMLQERLLTYTTGSDLPTNHRAESVPPGGTVQNNLYPSLNRAQSEQPHIFQMMPPIHAPHLPTIISQSASSANSFHRRNICNIQQQQQQQLSNHATAFNYANDQQTNVYSSSVNNLCGQMPSMPNFNNVGGNIAASAHAAGTPIFMHHHNNTQPPMHNNNSNLLNAAQQQSQQPAAAPTTAQSSQPTNVSNSASNPAGSALNNQVPPGNRANNYWDNFRSYSRQNLLSSNSCKSNEEQNHNQHQQLQQQHQQQLQQHQQQQPQLVQPQHQQEPVNLPIFTNSLNVDYRSDATTNNLNPPSYDNKYLHTFRNRINANSAMHSGGALMNASPIASSTSSTQTNNYSNMMNIAITQPESQHQHGLVPSAWNAVSGIGDSFESNDLAHDIRNMNINFGNNEPNKVPIKPSSLRRSTPSVNRRLRHTQSEPATYVEQQEDIIGAQQGTEASFNPVLFSGVMQSLDSAMDDTSDEIKRNLLVNALKSEKFTTKFYESLKEDVFRRIETLLRAKDGEQQFLAQLSRDYNIASTRDPLRKLYLNEVRSLSRPTEDLNDTESNNGENEEEDDDEDDEDGAQALDNHNILNNNNNEVQNALGLNVKDIKLLADKFIGRTLASTSAASTDQTVQFPDYELIHFIITRIHEHTQPSLLINDVALVEISKLTASAMQNYVILKCRKKEVFEPRPHISPKKIYAKLKTKSYPRDRDGFLMWYQRYLGNELLITLKRDESEDPWPSRENNNNSNQSNVNANQNIAQSALSWMDIHNIYMNAHQARKSNIPLRPTISQSGTSTSFADVENKIENNLSLKQQQQQQKQHHCQMNPRPQPPPPSSSSSNQIPTPTTPGSSNMMNEDLAEADQICSSSNRTMHISGEAHTDESFLLGPPLEIQAPPTPDNAEGQLISIPSESQPTTNPSANQHFLNFLLDETENNENPEEEHRLLLVADPGGLLTHPLLADSDNAEEDTDSQNQRPESSLHGAFGTDPLAINSVPGKRNSVP